MTDMLVARARAQPTVEQWLAVRMLEDAYLSKRRRRSVQMSSSYPNL
jgi:hypothetical protein